MGSVKLVSTINEDQRGFLTEMMNYLKSSIGEGAAPYPGSLFPDIPGLFTEAYEEYEAGRYGDVTRQAVTDLISGKPAYTFDPKATTSRWQETFATPIMETWRETVLPMVHEKFNVPGALYSRTTGKGLMEEAGKFYSGYVAPTLYSSLEAGERMGFESTEAAEARRSGALALPGALFSQDASVAMAKYGIEESQMAKLYAEFIRTRAEPGWAAEFGGQFAVAPTQTAISKGGGGGGFPLGDILGGLAANPKVWETVGGWF